MACLKWTLNRPAVESIYSIQVLSHLPHRAYHNLHAVSLYDGDLPAS